MSSKVILEVTLSNEFLATHFTLVVSLASVWLHVHIKVTFLCEMIAANVAFKGFNSEMLAKMDLQSWLLRVADVADMTFEWLLVRVVYQMSFEVPLGDEVESAAGELTLEGSFISL